jgi:hypothetical protein
MYRVTPSANSAIFLEAKRKVSHYIQHIYFLPVVLRPNADHGLLFLEVSRSHTTRHRRYDSSGRVISSSQRPQPENTPHSKQISNHTPGGFRISAGERSQTYGLDHAAAETGYYITCRYHIARPRISLD